MVDRERGGWRQKQGGRKTTKLSHAKTALVNMMEPSFTFSEATYDHRRIRELGGGIREKMAVRRYRRKHSRISVGWEAVKDVVLA